MATPDIKIRYPDGVRRTEQPVRHRDRSNDPRYSPGTAPHSPLDQPQTGDSIQEGGIGTREGQAGGLHPDVLTSRDEDNLVPDGGFELEATRRALGSGWEADSTVVDGGLFSVTTVADGTHRRHILRTGVSCIGGERLYLTGSYRAATGTPVANEGAGLGVIWKSDTGAELTWTVLINPNYDDVWHDTDGVANAPLSARSFDVALIITDGVTPGQQFWLDNLELRKLLSFKSDVTGARGELDIHGLRAFDGLGASTVDINFDTGDATFSGEMVGGSLTIDNDSFSDTKFRVENGLGVRWTANSNGDLAGRMSAENDDNASEWINTVFLVAETGFGETAEFEASPNPRTSGLFLAERHDKVAGEHFASSRLMAQRGGASGLEVYVAATSRFVNDSSAEHFVTVASDPLTDPPTAQFNLLARPTSVARYAAGTAAETKRRTSDFNFDNTDTTIHSATKTIYKLRNFMPEFYARGFRNASGGDADVEFQIFVFYGTNPLADPWDRLMSTPYTVPNGAGTGGLRSGDINVKANWDPPDQDHFGNPVTYPLDCLFQIRVRNISNANTLSVQGNAEFPMFFQVLDVGH